jgi:hypothetical protein
MTLCDSSLSAPQKLHSGPMNLGTIWCTNVVNYDISKLQIVSICVWFIAEVCLFTGRLSSNG